jgi:hypothetical protein
MAVIAFMAITYRAYAQNWHETTKVVASDRAETDWFGRAVSISGHFAIVGAYLKDNENADQNFILDEGAAYIYEKDMFGTWNQIQKIVASDKNEFDWFGCSVGISGDYVIVGAYVEDEDITGGNTMDAAGAAYIFEKDGSGNWIEVQKIVASDRFFNDSFGFSVGISNDYAIVGATNNNALGAAYMFERDNQGNWNEVQKITGDIIYAGEFGYSVSIHENHVIIGAPYEREEDDQGMLINWSVGASYIFERNGSGVWNRADKLVAPNREADDHFGNAVSISGDYVIIGSHWEDEDASESDSLFRAGAAYMYERDDSNNWNLAKKIISTDRAEYDEFGFSVSISGDMAAISAPFKNFDDGGSTHFTAGSIYMYKRNDSGNWEEIAKLTASDRNDTDHFGIAVSISGNYVIAGAYYESEDASGENTLIQSGSAYIFSYCSEVENNLTETICKDDSVLLGGQYQFNSGTYYDTLRASTGCDSVVITELTVIVIDTTITLVGTTLTVAEIEASYQWIDCNAEQIIPGETNKSFTFNAEGSYAVEISKNGCIDTSSCHVISVLGITKNDFGTMIKVFPNPTSNYINIGLGKVFNDFDLQVVNMVGDVVMRKHYDQQKHILLNFRDLPSGLYFIQLKSKEKKVFIRVVKNR